MKEITAPVHVIAIQLSGKLTGDDMKAYRSILETKLSSHVQIGILMDFTGLTDMNADAFTEGIKADLDFLRHIDQIGHLAFVSDKEWLNAVFNFLKPVFPTFEMKVYASDQSDEAMRWVSEQPEARKPQAPALRFFPTSQDDVLAFEINGMISGKEMPGIIKKFKDILQQHEKVRLLNRIKHFGGIDPAVFMQHGLVAMKLAAIRKLERYAIVGAPGWMCKIVEILNPEFEDMEMRTFPEDRESEAWAWLGAQSAE